MNPDLSADIYGYWASMQGIILAAQYPEDQELKVQLRTAVETYLKVARGLGCPAEPNLDVLGFNLSTGKPGGRPEPMNRLGNAPSLAWLLLVGFQVTGDPEYLSLLSFSGLNAAQFPVDELLGGVDPEF